MSLSFAGSVGMGLGGAGQSLQRGMEMASEEMRAEVAQRFEFHPATEVTGMWHDAVRVKHRELALWIADNLPESRERALALTALQESMMWCNATVAYRK